MGRISVIKPPSGGGSGGGGAATPPFEMFIVNPTYSVYGKWSDTATIPGPKNVFAGSAIVGDTLYVIGGMNHASNLSATAMYDTVYAYDLVATTWATKAVAPMKWSEFYPVTVNGKVYCIGGNPWLGAAQRYDRVLRIYDPVTDTWTTGTPFPPIAVNSWGTKPLNVCAIGQTIYVVYMKQLWAYDVATDTWTQKASSTVDRGKSGVATVGGILYAFGGTFGTAAEKYDPATNTWTALAAVPATMSSGSATALTSGKIVVVSWLSQKTYLYDPAANTYTEMAPMPYLSGQARVLNHSSGVIGTGGQANTDQLDKQNVVQKMDTTFKKPAPIFPPSGSSTPLMAHIMYPPGAELVTGTYGDSGKTVLAWNENVLLKPTDADPMPATIVVTKSLGTYG